MGLKWSQVVCRLVFTDINNIKVSQENIHSDYQHVITGKPQIHTHLINYYALTSLFPDTSQGHQFLKHKDTLHT